MGPPSLLGERFQDETCLLRRVALPRSSRLTDEAVADESSTLAKEAEEKAHAASNLIKRRLWEVVADEWREAEKRWNASRLQEYVRPSVWRAL